MTGPILNTARCVLRPHHADDFPHYQEFWCHEANDVPGGPPLDAGAAWSRLLFFVGHWRHFGFGMFLVFDRTTGKIAGELGYRFIPREIGPSFDNHPEAGWNFGKSYRGRGLASEAMSASTDWMDAHFPGRTVCFLDPENHASLRIASKIGFQAFAEGHFKSNPVILLERLCRPERGIR